MGALAGIAPCLLSAPARRLVRMPPTPAPSGSVRSAAVVNAEIRALWADRGDPRVRLTREDRARYERLYAEWADAVRAGVVEAA